MFGMTESAGTKVDLPDFGSQSKKFTITTPEEEKEDAGMGFGPSAIEQSGVSLIEEFQSSLEDISSTIALH